MSYQKERLDNLKEVYTFILYTTLSCWDHGQCPIVNVIISVLVQKCPFVWVPLSVRSLVIYKNTDFR